MSIKTALALLNEMKAQGVIADYAVCEAVAASNYLDPVATLDLDVFLKMGVGHGKPILIDPTSIFEFLAKKGHEMEGGHVVVDGWPVQFLAPPETLGDEALKNAVYVDADGLSVRIITAEYLAAIALQAGRMKDKLRLLSFLEMDGFDRAAFDDIVRRFNLSESWERIVEEFHLRG